MTETLKVYAGLYQAFDFFNQKLWNGELPDVMLTLNRKRTAYGYFWGGKFVQKGTGVKKDEIALNPDTFNRADRETFSTLAHEMAHLWQQHNGKPGRGNYHNSEWAKEMKRIGLLPYCVKDPSKETGQGCSHRIEDGGAFDAVCAEYLASGAALDWLSALDPTEKPGKGKKSKVKYECPDCGAKAWAKPGANLMCGDCEQHMEAEESDEDGEESEAA